MIFIPVIAKFFLNLWNQKLNYYVCEVMHDEHHPKK